MRVSRVEWAQHSMLYANIVHDAGSYESFMGLDFASSICPEKQFVRACEDNNDSCCRRSKGTIGAAATTRLQMPSRGRSSQAEAFRSMHDDT